MKRFILGVRTAAALLQLVACGKPAEPLESVEALAADPQRLKELRAQCKTPDAKVGDAQCKVVAEAMRRQFMRETPSPYADDPVRSRVAPVPPVASDSARRDTKD
jgi:hypothetical protein